jgi:hypothetical protein
MKEREDNIEMHMKLLIGFTWLKIQNSGLPYAQLREKP